MHEPRQLVTVPNALTLLRLAALPAIILLFRREREAAACALFVLTMLTDCVDGWLARRLGQQTALGVYLDPVVDKIVLVGLFYELAAAGIVSAWIPHLFLAREMLQNAVRNVAAAGGTVVGANWMGKTKAALQTVLLAVGLMLPELSTGGWGDRAPVMLLVYRSAAWGLVILAYCFFALFIGRNRRLFLS